ncbi:TenA family transcriptional regulator [Methyloversatilis thermotolerans]|uniref:TenA family transcriptional regulator n=1 Tax=Methyloversatilis thermotolerans TaxID=1346290 RepID=UPI00037FC0CC|nr:iron-containing redox enzyme family protein [Methyloversatilis thermotolerans]
MSFHDRLQRETAAERAHLLSAPIIQDALAGRVTLHQYQAFLTQAFHHVRHTVPLLMACGARLPARHEGLRRAVAEYIEEEIGHEEWILNDIAVCGGDKDAVRASAPGLEAELMVAYAYDWIARNNPVGFFGMVHVLEGTSVQIASAAADRIARVLGLPPAAFSYLNSHGTLDQDHVRFFATLMDGLDDADDQAAVIHVARVMYRLYGDIFRALPAAEAALAA